MRRILIPPVACLLGLVGLTACDRPAPTAPVAEAPGISASAHADAPGAAVVIPFSATQPGDDPCTPVVDENEHQVTFAGTLYLQELPGGTTLIRREYTITTDSGYEGQGKIVRVEDGAVLTAHFNDMVRHPDGRQFRAHAVQVVDLTTAPPTVRVLKIHPLTCVRS